MKIFIDKRFYNYVHLQYIADKDWICGYCTCHVSSERGYEIRGTHDGQSSQAGGIYICPNCGGPTFFSPQRDVLPSPMFGNTIGHLPTDIEATYEEARRCTGQNCHTAAVLLCRKILMNIAVSQEAKKGLKFIQYVEFLSENHFIPPNGKQWVEYIREKGNEATHEISVMTPDDSEKTLIFTSMLLKFVYEFSELLPPSDDS